MTHELKIEDIVKAGRLDQDDLKELRSWVDSLGATEIPDEILALSLMACDRNQEGARNTIRAHFKIKNSAPELFNNLCIDDEGIKSSYETLYHVILPRRTSKNLAVVFQRLHDNSFRKFDILSHLRRCILQYDCLMSCENPPDGIICVVDLKDVCFIYTSVRKQLRAVTDITKKEISEKLQGVNFPRKVIPVKLIAKVYLGPMVKFFHFLQEGFLFKIHSLHFINTGLIFKYLMNIFRFAIRGDLIDKMICYSNAVATEEFYRNCLPPECRPSDYGGLLPSLGELNQITKVEITKFQTNILEEQKLREKYKKIIC